MRLVDLGKRDAPVLLFGGPYSNLQATHALLNEAQNLGISNDHCICTGDVVAYCGSPAETVAAIRDSDCIVVAGNCEKQLGADAEDCGCGFDAGSLCQRLSVGWYDYANARIKASERAWMAQLPDIVVFSHQGCRHAVIHGGVTNVSRFMWSASDESDFQEEIYLIQSIAGDIETIISGHSGLAFERRVGNVRWINAGAIGMPAHDGRRETQFAVIADGKPTFHRLQYDAEGARRRMVVAGLTQGYHDALVTGYWPSEDVLPPTLRRAALANG